MGADHGDDELGSYLDVTNAQIISLTRLRRAQMAAQRLRERYGDTIRADPTSALTYKLLAMGRRYARPPNPPHTRYITVETHDAILALQGGRFYLCDRGFTDEDWATQDHVVPREKGGQNDGNVLLAHLLCNEIKADRWPTEAEIAYRERVHGRLASTSSRESPAAYSSTFSSSGAAAEIG